MAKASDLEKIEKLASDMQDMSEMNFGSRLQRKRISQKISVEDLASRTYISRDFLHALEANEFDKLPSEAYTVGFIRTYCKVLDIDSDEYISEYKRYLAIFGQQPKNKHIADNMVTLQRQSRRKFYVFIFALLLMLSGVGATIGFIYYQKFAEQKANPPVFTLQKDGALSPSNGASSNGTPPSFNSGLQQPKGNSQ